MFVVIVNLGTASKLVNTFLSTMAVRVQFFKAELGVHPKMKVAHPVVCLLNYLPQTGRSCVALFKKMLRHMKLCRATQFPMLALENVSH